MIHILYSFKVPRSCSAGQVDRVRVDLAGALAQIGAHEVLLNSYLRILRRSTVLHNTKCLIKCHRLTLLVNLLNAIALFYVFRFHDLHISLYSL